MGAVTLALGAATLALGAADLALGLATVVFFPRAAAFALGAALALPAALALAAAAFLVAGTALPLVAWSTTLASPWPVVVGGVAAWPAPSAAGAAASKAGCCEGPAAAAPAGASASASPEVSWALGKRRRGELDVILYRWEEVRPGMREGRRGREGRARGMARVRPRASRARPFFFFSFLLPPPF